MLPEVINSYTEASLHITYIFTITFHVCLSFVIYGGKERRCLISVLQHIMKILNFEVKRHRKNITNTSYKVTDNNQIFLS